MSMILFLLVNGKVFLISVLLNSVLAYGHTMRFLGKCLYILNVFSCLCC